MKILVKWETYHGGDEGSESQEIEIEQVEKDTAQKVIDRFFDAVTVDPEEREKMLLRITPQIKIDEETMMRLNEEIRNTPLTVFEPGEMSVQPIFTDENALEAFESIVERYPDLKGVEGTLSEAVEEVRKKLIADGIERMKEYDRHVEETNERIMQKRNAYQEAQAKGINLFDAAERIADWKNIVDRDEEKGDE